MPHLDRANRRLELKLVYWGPARGGKTTSLRSLHGACDAGERGELSSVDTEDERTYYFDYAPMNLPRYRDFAIRVNAYTVPGQEAYVETRRRILRGADGVIFVADGTPEAQAANLSSWRQLDDCLRTLEGAGVQRPVIVAANKQDMPGALKGEEIARRLAAAVPARSFVDLVETTATAGKGVVRCFRSALVAAADHALAPEAGEGATAARRQFLAALDARFRGGADGVPIAEAAPTRSIQVPVSSNDPDAGGLLAALETSRWLAVRDLDVRELQRERALGRLLLDLGHLCLAANDVESLSRSVLASLVMNLDAVTGWVGLPDGAGGERVFDPMGPAHDPSGIAETAHCLGMGVPDGRAAPVGAGTTSSFPGGAAGGLGLFLPFGAGGGRRGWLLLVGPPTKGLPADAEAVLAPAGAFLGLTLSRLSAVAQLRTANSLLEQKVDERTHELRREKESLENRVGERTRELERAKQSTVDMERKFLDRERAEGVHRLAAGLAHELNNPVGAVKANLDFLREGLARVATGDGRIAPDEVADLLAAVEDARRDTDRVATSITSLFGEATNARRAAVRTSLAAAARDALKSWAEATPGAPVPKLVELEPVSVGVPPGECARWLFRLLTLLGRVRSAAMKVEIGRSPDGPRVGLEVDQPLPTDATATLESLAKEVSKAGGRLEAGGTGKRTLVRVVFPRALGETKAGALGGAR